MDVYRDYHVFHDLFVALDEAERQVLREFNLTIMQYHALLLLDPQEGWRLTDLSERLLCERSTVTRVVDFLEKEGLLNRFADVEDRRSQRVRLTSAGMALRDRARVAHETSLREHFSHLNEEEQQQLYKLHLKLLQGLRSDREHASKVV